MVFIETIWIKPVFSTMWLKVAIKIWPKEQNLIDKALRDKAFKMASNPKCNGYKRGLVWMVYKFFDKKSAGRGAKSTSNQHVADELHKLITRKFK